MDRFRASSGMRKPFFTTDQTRFILAVLGLLSLLAILIAQLATTVSRIRDAGYSVLWVIAIFVPYFGLIAWIVFGCLESKKA